ncbi:MAG: DNA-binding response regulator [Nitrospirae bacterium GWD2_57_9]|nr:MAG: DNA-binding response regulator [Nitrospirae bacterium GWD2_57_9]OGW45210.1 MAG: DNA-binding response regulator [Nitrospirae bacterium GWC2_57_9]
MTKKKVLIADDHALVREGICAFLKLCDDVVVVAEASDGIEAIEKTDKFHPDIIIMDVNMPKLGGLEATIEIKKMHPEVKVLVLTQYEDREYISRFLKAGVSGYLLKKAVGSDLITALKAIGRGELYLYSSIASEVVAGYLQGDGQAEVDEPYDRLSDREKQVLKLVAEGHTHKEVADMLSISVKTVIAHQTNMGEKLGIHARAGLIKFAIQKGIIKIDG